MNKPKFKKFIRANLASSKNSHLKVMADRDWSLVPGKDTVKLSYALLRDAKGGLTFNGYAFTKSKEYLGLPENDKQDFAKLSPQFKTFLKKQLFSHLSDEDFEKEYTRLTESYAQAILSEAYQAILNPLCKQKLERATTSNAVLDKKLSHDLTYTKGTFAVMTTMSSMAYIPDITEKAKVKIPGTFFSIYKMGPKDSKFSFDSFNVSNSFLRTLLFKEHIKIDKNIAALIDTNTAVNNLYVGCKNYKMHLRTSVIYELRKSNPALASYLNEPIYKLDPNSVEIKASPETGLDDLIHDPNMEKKIATFSRSTQLAIKKYKVISDIQNDMDKQELAVYKPKTFVLGVLNNVKLLRTNRDSYFVTFIKVAVSMLTFGAAARLLFDTEADAFLDKTFPFTLFSAKKQAVQKVPAPLPKVRDRPKY